MWLRRATERFSGKNELPFRVDCVEKSADWALGLWRSDKLEQAIHSQLATYPAPGIIGLSFASFRRFWAVAARVNSSWTPHGPRNRSRPSPSIRLR